jgi:hypothetical protein
MNPNTLIPLTGLLCPLLFIGFVVAVIILILRMLRAAKNRSDGSGVSPPPLADVPTQAGEDGFWINSCPAGPGSIVCYHYWSGGTRYSGRVPFKPGADGRQFVYTGRRPEQVSIVRIVEVDDDDDLSSTLIPPIIAAGLTSQPFDDISPPSPPPSSSPSFPTAY